MIIYPLHPLSSRAAPVAARMEIQKTANAGMFTLRAQWTARVVYSIFSTCGMMGWNCAPATSNLEPQWKGSTRGRHLMRSAVIRNLCSRYSRSSPLLAFKGVIVLHIACNRNFPTIVYDRAIGGTSATIYNVSFRINWDMMAIERRCHNITR